KGNLNTGSGEQDVQIQNDGGLDDTECNPFEKMQTRLRELQEELSSIEAEGTAGDGAVKIIFAAGTGFESVSIARELVTRARRAELEKLVLEAARSAVTEVLDAVKTKTQALHKELGLT